MFVGVIPQRLAIKVGVDLSVVIARVVRRKSQLLAVEDSTVAHHVPADLSTVMRSDTRHETAESHEACCWHVHGKYLDVKFFASIYGQRKNFAGNNFRPI